MNKIRELVVKTKELRDELYSITYGECQEFYEDEMVFDTEMKEIRLDLNYAYDKLEAMVHYIDGEYSCLGCGKWFSPSRGTDSDEDHMCSECQEKFSEIIELDLQDVLQ
ncbi:MAG TPA: hypothetical protein GX523_10180 [Desulfitobacterium dehalogenans]|uniref:Uncharacterized protein n=1 Tax=Desulfitobacterium dehalogenans TaxID=36854 RepID=A0A7C6Z4M3_9FIRM|nr:hypothetical protein [Desulfitobacterium dehalogenans]